MVNQPHLRSHYRHLSAKYITPTYLRVGYYFYSHMAIIELTLLATCRHVNMYIEYDILIVFARS